jgi:hypothetical protein
MAKVGESPGASTLYASRSSRPLGCIPNLAIAALSWLDLIFAVRPLQTILAMHAIRIGEPRHVSKARMKIGIVVFPCGQPRKLLDPDPAANGSVRGKYVLV